MDDILPKPLRMSALMDTLHKWLPAKESHAVDATEKAQT
jgi:hypothetical protein